MGFQRVTLIGRLGKDPEMRYSANGNAITTFSVAVGERYKGEEKTEWFNVVSFGKTAELLAQHFQKGKEIHLEGKMQTRKWEKDGQMHYRTELVAREFSFVGGGGNGSTGPVDFDDMDPDDLPFE